MLPPYTGFVVFKGTTTCSNDIKCKKHIRWFEKWNNRLMNLDMHIYLKKRLVPQKSCHFHKPKHACSATRVTSKDYTEPSVGFESTVCLIYKCCEVVLGLPVAWNLISMDLIHTRIIKSMVLWKLNLRMRSIKLSIFWQMGQWASAVLQPFKS